MRLSPFLAAAAALIVLGCARRKEPAPAAPPERHTMGASAPPTGGVVRWLDTDDAGLPCARVLAAVERDYEQVFAPPPAPVYQGVPFAANGSPAPTSLATQRHTAPIAHCAQRQRYALPMRAAEAIEWAVVAARCSVAVDAGATGACADVVSCPALVTTRDATWTPDGGPCWWEDGGLNPIPTPPDPYDGGTP